MRWQARVLDPEEVFAFIKRVGAATTKEVKDHFKTDSGSVRVAMGHLLIQRKIWVVGGKPKSSGWGPCAIFYMENTHEKGNPNPHKRRSNAGVLVKMGSYAPSPNNIFTYEEALDYEGWTETLVPNGKKDDKKSYLVWLNKKNANIMKVRFDLMDDVPTVEFGQHYDSPDFWDAVPGYRP